MSLGQLSSRGKQNNKLYMIHCTTNVDGRNFDFYFYSSEIISNKTQLIQYLRLRNRNYTIGVFGSNYQYQSNDFIVLSSLKADGGYNIVYLYYYKNDGNGWRMYQTGSISFTCFEM